MKNLNFSQILAALADKETRERFLVWVLVGLVSAQMTIFEVQFIESKDQIIFLTVKIIICLAFILCGFMFLTAKRPRVQSYVYALLTAIYCTFSGLYRGYYCIVAFEMCAVLVFLFPMTWKDFVLQTTAIFGIFFGSIFLRWPDVPENRQYLSADEHLSLLIQQLVILGIFYFVLLRAQNLRLMRERKFGLLGRQASRVSHDLKGMIASPLLYLEKLKDEKRKGFFSDEQYEKSIQFISEQLVQIHGTLTELARLCSLDELPTSKFTLSEAIRSSGFIYIKQLHGISIDIKGDLIFECDRAVVSSIFSNLFSNSLTVFSQKKILNPKIQIYVNEKKEGFTYTDNAGGFPAEILSKLKAKSFCFSVESGSGLGLRVITEAMKKLGGEIIFSNGSEGVKIHFTFDPHLLGREILEGSGSSSPKPQEKLGKKRKINRPLALRMKPSLIFTKK